MASREERAVDDVERPRAGVTQTTYTWCRCTATVRPTCRRCRGTGILSCETANREAVHARVEGAKP